jgi:hypothetical protein
MVKDNHSGFEKKHHPATVLATPKAKFRFLVAMFGYREGWKADSAQLSRSISE